MDIVNDASIGHLQQILVILFLNLRDEFLEYAWLISCLF